MAKRTVEINDTLDQRLESAYDDVKAEAIRWLDDNDDADEAPDLGNDLDYSGAIHEIVDGSVPVYTGEINDLWYLYGDRFEDAFDDAGIGDKNDKGWPCGWKAAAIYCYIEREVASWYEDNKEEIYEEWRKEHPLPEDEDEDEDELTKPVEDR